MPKKKDPNAVPRIPARPLKRRGWLICDACTMSLEFASYGKGDDADGGWPRHRCRAGNIRPFATWQTTDPHPMAFAPPSVLEGR